ncbi:calcium:cation antiporter [Pseudodonghicola xiamenensis]|uniref:Putative ionic transporter y4hA n=1 Tax=Pseudodonghicola xiamenensis TaxID=337702 RepID=A0A8J3H713_9RHOB|nr:ionic transporter y4hA [Pseudodonghicola xiamenensis]GHG94811.1 putative ionic transporter y4hA [Pseudodonghicola xiamenensis]
MKAIGSPAWTLFAPLLGLGTVGVLETVYHDHPPAALYLISAAVLFGSVFAAVHHAEVIAHRIGQPFGSVLLALAVTLIEVSLIVSVLFSDSSGDSSVARDTVFAAIMIVLNGIVGLCLLIGGLRYHEQGFQPRGTAAALGVLGTQAVLGLILPNYTEAIPGPVYAPEQLIFVAVFSLLLYLLFLFVQMVSHQSDFLEPIELSRPPATEPERHHEVSRPTLIVSAIALPVSLVAVVLLAEALAAPVRHAILGAGLPEALVGVVIALIVLLPEGLASVKAAMQNRLQTSLNLAMGSALASLCLTIPIVALVSVAMGHTLVLGLDAEHIVLLVLTLFMSTLSLAMGRTTIMQGGIHLVIFGAFLTIATIP